MDLPVVLHEEMDLYMKHVVLPPSIALTRALKENVFSVIVGIDTWTMFRLFQDIGLGEGVL